MPVVNDSEIVIRTAHTDDLPGLLTLLNENHLPHDGLREHLGTILVACAEKYIVGSAGLELYGTFALLRSVSISPALQKKGLGHQLTNAALDLARQHDIEHVFLLTETAEGFFPRFGFKITTRGDVPPAVQQSLEFTSACPQSAVVMSLNLRALVM